jgi:transposase
MKAFTENQIAELKSVVDHGDDDSRYFKKVQAIYWRTQGRRWKEIVELSGIQQSTLWYACRLYRESGLDALRPHYAGSRYRKLTFEEEEAVLDKLLNSACVGKYVRASDLVVEFEAISGVSYQKDAFYRVLRRHGWRKKMPRGQHPKKASDEAIEASKKLTP